jgi:3-oxoadipate enol-lactonase
MNMEGIMIFKSKGGDIFYNVCGPAGAKVVAFTHGAGLDSGMYAAQAAALENDYRVLVWDMPGHGRSHRLTNDFSCFEMVEHLCGILDELQVERAALVGQSMGSWVSQLMAIRAPERVSALVSIAGTPLNAPLPKMTGLYRIMPPLMRLLPEGFMMRWMAKVRAATPAAQAYFAHTLQQMGMDQFLLVFNGMQHALEAQIQEMPRQPLLITHGEHEYPKWLIGIGRRWHAESPGSRFEILPGAGHNANQDNPEAFNRVLMAFLEDVMRENVSRDGDKSASLIQV